jgi:hypothetical protein
MPHELPPHHEDHPRIISRNARIGLVLFCIYFLLYAGFILANVLKPAWMASTEIPMDEHVLYFGGPNLAIVYGIGLIFAALALSLVYMRLTRQRT